MRLSSTVTFLLVAASAWAAPCRDLGKEVIDEGCTDMYPTCVYRNGGQVVGGNAGHHCALCINSRQPNDVDQVAPDEGCDEEFRVCVGSRQLASNVEGTACAVCFNSISAALDPNDIDDGCPPTAPVCVNDAGQSPAIWTPGTKCVANCFDTSLLGGDKGCPRRYPNCVLKDGSDPGKGNTGEQCSICSPATCDDNDPCTDDFCDPETGCYHEDNGSCQCGEPADYVCEWPIPWCTDDFSCVCDIDTEGAPFCWPARTCVGLVTCTSNDDCEGNTRCASTCCPGGNVCLEPCGPHTVGVRALRRSGQEEQEKLTGATTIGFF